MIRKHVFKDKAENDSIRWRLHEPSRLEAFSDTVIAFALTLTVISLEVPQTFDQLLNLMQGFFAFAICFLFLILIWHDQYVFFRRFGLQDTRTIFYNMILLFMVIYLVYPLRFLFYSFNPGFHKVLENGQEAERFKDDMQACQLMIIYDIGYFVIYTIMALMYAHALKRKDDILLSRLEVYNTKTYVLSFMGRIGVVLFSFAIAIYGLTHDGGYAFYSGISYSLIGFVIWIIQSRRGKKIKHLFSKEEIDEVKNEIIILEEKKI